MIARLEAAEQVRAIEAAVIAGAAQKDRNEHLAALRRIANPRAQRGRAKPARPADLAGMGIGVRIIPTDEAEGQNDG